MTAPRITVLIIGGYGTFGGRLARLLAREERLTLVIAGRSKRRAEEFCARLPTKAALVPLELDRDGDVAAQLRAIAPGIVVDASGPFQVYGAASYRVAEAAIAVGAHYIDLADSADHVTGIARLDGKACARGVFVLSGASSVPALTTAVVRRLERGLPAVEAVSGGIAPSPHAGVGLNVIRAIASYAGKPIALLRDGRPGVGYPLTEVRRYTIAPPGAVPLRNIRFSLMDVPELALLPASRPRLRAVWFGAGPVPETLHRVLNAFAWLVRLKVLPSLSPFARLMHRASNGLRWGEARSGMFVHVSCTRGDGARVERSWHVVAEGADGLFIPAMAAAAIIRRCLAGRHIAPGARAATSEIELDDYEAMFAEKRIVAGVRESSPETAGLPLYRRLLGAAYDLLPPPLQDMHDVSERTIGRGHATVVRGGGLLARLVAAMVGFPRSGTDVAVEVRFSSRRGGEEWRRSFDGRTFASLLTAGRGRFEQLLCERFGPVVFGMALVIDGGALRLVLRRWTIFGLPLPVSWAPFGECYEHVEDGRFCFHVEIGHPLTGPIVNYRGWLVPERSCSDITRQTVRDPALVNLGAGT